MNRFFGLIKDNKITLSEESIHHLINVLRLEINEEIEVVIDEKVYLAKIKSLKPLDISLIKEINENRETNINIYLAFSLLKGGHDDLLIQKCVELGVNTFYPYISERTIISLKNENEKDKRLLRFKKIIEGASEQSKRLIFPDIAKISSFKEIMNISINNRYIAYEGEAMKSNTLFKELPKIKKGDGVLILIGPEGGFSIKEIELAKSKGFKAISLGKRILRAETACMYASALLSTYGDEL